MKVTTKSLCFTSIAPVPLPLSCAVYQRTSSWHGTTKISECKDCDSYSLTKCEKMSLTSERIERLLEIIKTKVYTIDPERNLPMYCTPCNLKPWIFCSFGMLHSFSLSFFIPLCWRCNCSVRNHMESIIQDWPSFLTFWLFYRTLSSILFILVQARSPVSRWCCWNKHKNYQTLGH